MPTATAQSTSFKASLRARELANAIRRCLSFLPKSPIQSRQIRVCCSSDYLALQSGDAECGLTALVRAGVVDPQEFCVPGDLILRTIEACQKSVEHVTSHAIELSLVDGKLRIESEAGMVLEILCSDEDRVPAWPVLKKPWVSGTIPSTIAFGPLLDEIESHASKDEQRINLHCLAVEHDGEVCHAIACDGHRMVIARREFMFPKMELTPLPLQLASILPEGQLDVTIDETYVMFTCPDGSKIWAKKIPVTYPPWRSVVPKDYFEKGIRLDTARLRTTVEAMAVIMTGSKSAMKMEFGASALVCSLDNDGIERAAARRSVRRFGKLKPPSSKPTAVQPKFVAEALDVIGECPQVRVYWESNLDPVVFYNDDNSIVVVTMPMRI